MHCRICSIVSYFSGHCLEKPKGTDGYLFPLWSNTTFNELLLPSRKRRHSSIVCSCWNSSNNPWISLQYVKVLETNFSLVIFLTAPVSGSLISSFTLMVMLNTALVNLSLNDFSVRRNVIFVFGFKSFLSWSLDPNSSAFCGGILIALTISLKDDWPSGLRGTAFFLWWNVVFARRLWRQWWSRY